MIKFNLYTSIFIISSLSLQVNEGLLKLIVMSNRTNLLSTNKINPLRFFTEVKTELSKVVWPTKEETIRLTGIVIVASVAIGLFIGGLDFLFTFITSLIIK